MSNTIHPTAIIEGDVELGSENHIDAYCILKGPLKIGSGNRISPLVTIGTPGQDTRNRHYDSSNFHIIEEFLEAIKHPTYPDKDITFKHIMTHT